VSQSLNITVPLTPSAFHRFGVEAQALGISLEAHLARLTQRGFGISLAESVSTLFEDAADEAAANEEAITTGRERPFGNPLAISKSAA